MKKLFLTIGFLLITLLCMGQIQSKFANQNYFVPDYNTTPQINITVSQIPNGNGWAQSGTACAGCPSYYYKIQRTVSNFRAEDGGMYYYFFFYFFSNSYYGNGNQASTYLKDINFYGDQNWAFNLEYLVLNPGVTIAGAWMRSANPSCVVQFTVTQMTVY